MRTQFGETLASIFATSKDAAAAIDADRTLSPSGKVEKSRAIRLAAYGQARDTAAAELVTRRQAVTRANERHSEAAQRERQREDPVRASLALSRAQLVAQNASWEQVQQGIDGALASGDPYALRAWSDLAPLLHRRFDSDQQAGVQLIRSHRAVFDALEGGESPDLRATREALEAAEGALQAVVDDVNMLIFEGKFDSDRLKTSMLQEAVSGPRAEPVRVDTGDGGYYLESAGGQSWLK